MQLQFKRCFTLDLRSLAIFRIAVALLLLGDLALRSRSINAHYTDAGILPRDLEYATYPFNPSLHSFGGSMSYEVALFALAALFAVAMLVGYRTRWATILSWIMLISLQNRNILILSAADAYFRLLVFWSMFLPLGARYSLDEKRAPKTDGRNAYFSFATAALILQIFVVYFFSGLAKMHAPLWNAGAGVQLALLTEEYVTTVGKWLMQYPDFLFFINPFVMAFEVYAVFLLFVPYEIRTIRYTLIALFWAFHLNNTIILGTISHTLVGMVAWISVLPWPGKNEPDNGKTSEKKSAALNSKKAAKKNAELKKAGKEFYPPLTTAYPLPVLAKIGCTLFFSYIVLVNVSWWSPNSFHFSKTEAKIGNYLAFDQVWTMFTSSPDTMGWYVIEGDLHDGSKVDLFRDGAPIDWKKPELVSDLFKTDRWRKYYEVFFYPTAKIFYDNWGRYLCADWNEKHPTEQALDKLEIVFMDEKPLVKGGWSDPVKKSLWSGACLPQ